MEELKKNIGDALINALSTEKRKPGLRMSNAGQPCERKLWYEINETEKGEELRPETRLKFLYGHILEEVLLFLAEVAGHEVTGRQTQLSIEGIKGHRDAVISGTLVDVKSASSFSFKKFATGGLKEDDPFGYLPQIQSYLFASQEDPLVTDKSRAAFLVVDKTLGHLTLDVHEKDEKNYPEIYGKKKEVITGSIPDRAFESVPFQQGGNEKLGVNCSYCAFSKTCWPEGRTFLYSYGPVTLVKIKKEPNVMEITNVS